VEKQENKYSLTGGATKAEYFLCSGIIARFTVVGLIFKLKQLIYYFILLHSSGRQYTSASTAREACTFKMILIKLNHFN